MKKPILLITAILFFSVANAQFGLLLMPQEWKQIAKAKVSRVDNNTTPVGKANNRRVEFVKL
jgi:hypothetical protein